MLSEHRKVVLKAWYARTREQRRRKHAEWRAKNPEKLAAAARKRTPEQRRAERERAEARNPGHKAALNKAHYNANADTYKKRAATWKTNNPERARELDREWRKQNRERHKASKRAAWHRKMQTTRGRLNHTMGRLMWMALRKRGKKAGVSWQTLVGYSVDDLHAHLAARFRDGMNWDAFLRGEIHVDHIRPLSWFRYASSADPEFRECWALENLQPLWARDNMVKQDRWAG